MFATAAPVSTAARVVAAVIRSGAAIKEIPGRANRMGPIRAMGYGIADHVSLQTGISTVR
jgi:hypothetical protein